LYWENKSTQLREEKKNYLIGLRYKNITQWLVKNYIYIFLAFFQRSPNHSIVLANDSQIKIRKHTTTPY
jgi:hypothetical protein